VARVKQTEPRGSKASVPLARVEVDILKLVPGGFGLARHESRTFLVPDVCPGERVVIDLRSSRPRVAEVLRASPDRVTPACPHLARCGGCDFMHVRAERQGALHAEVVRELLAHGADEEIPEARVQQLSRSTGYRTRARLAFRSTERSVVLGFRSERSHDIVAFERCLVLDPRLEPAVAIVRRVLAGAVSEGEVALALGHGGAPVLEVRSSRDLAPATFSALHGLVESKEIAGARIVLGETTKPLVFGDPRGVQMGADDLPLLVGAGGFAQASEEGAIELARRVAALVEPAEKRVVELFAGSGTLSVLLAKSARSFVGVEIDKEAHASAKANLDARGITAKLVCSDAEAFSIPACDVVVLDPPRSGAKGAVEKLLTARPKRIVYVSCDPATLARDVARLRTGGYVLTAIETIELFPQTSHVETVVVLEPRKKRAKAHAGGAA